MSYDVRLMRKMYPHPNFATHKRRIGAYQGPLPPTIKAQMMNVR